MNQFMPHVLLLMSLVLPVVVVLQVPRPAGAQQSIEIKTAPPEERVPKPEILLPPGSREITRPRESDFYPDDIRVRIDPAFIAPLTAIWQTGPKSAVQFGLAGWTAPNTPVSQGAGTHREMPGWFALGFAIVWDLAVEQGGPAAPAAAPR